MRLCGPYNFFLVIFECRKKMSISAKEKKWRFPCMFRHIFQFLHWLIVVLTNTAVIRDSCRIWYRYCVVIVIPGLFLKGCNLSHVFLKSNLSLHFSLIVYFCDFSLTWFSGRDKNLFKIQFRSMSPSYFLKWQNNLIHN